jgi:hypothetical protein
MEEKGRRLTEIGFEGSSQGFFVNLFTFSKLCRNELLLWTKRPFFTSDKLDSNPFKSASSCLMESYGE